MLLYIINQISLSDATAALLKVALHKPTGVARIEFVAYEANYEDTSTIEQRKRFFPILKLYPSTAGWASIERSGSHGDEITPPRAPVPRKPILDAQEILERLPDDCLGTRLRPDHRKCCELFVSSFTP